MLLLTCCQGIIAMTFDAIPTNTYGSLSDWEKFLSSNIACTVIGQLHDLPSTKHALQDACRIRPDMWHDRHLWSEKHTRIARAAIPLLQNPAQLLKRVSVRPEASPNFEDWRITIKLDDSNEAGATIPLEERISIICALKGSEPEIAPQEVLAIVAAKLAERVAVADRTAKMNVTENQKPSATDGK